MPAEHACSVAFTPTSATAAATTFVPTHTAAPSAARSLNRVPNEWMRWSTSPPSRRHRPMKTRSPKRPTRRTSRKQPLQPARLRHSADGNRVRRRPVVAVGFVGLGIYLVEDLFHHLLQFVLDALAVPEEVVQTLHPFEVADR